MSIYDFLIKILNIFVQAYVAQICSKSHNSFTNMYKHMLHKIEYNSCTSMSCVLVHMLQKIKITQLMCKCFHTLHANLFYSFYTVRELCDLAITSDASVSKSLLNYLNLILELNLDRLFSAL